MLNNRKFGAGALLTFCVVALFAPDLESPLFRDGDANESVSRQLNEMNEELDPAPGEMTFSCDKEGYAPYRVDWSDVELEDDVAEQTITLVNGFEIKMKVTDTGTGKAHSWGKDDNGYLYFTAGHVPSSSDVITSEASPDGLEYPGGFSTLSLEFDRELEGLYISISDVDSNRQSSDAVRIRMEDSSGAPISTTITKTGDINVVGDFGFEGRANQRANNPGLEASLYAKALGPVQKISLDQSVFLFTSSRVGKYTRRTIYPGLDFAYCAPTMPPTPAPIPSDGGVNGDPLIMGLAGQLFKFEGHSGSWYSAVSTPSFQWNMKVQRYEQCPSFSDNFISGVGFSYTDPKGKIEKKIEVSVANPYEVDIGCGGGIKSCLGGGSLEIVLDGVKIVTGGDYKFEDGTGRIIAFNTFHDCSRKWYDFDVTPAAGEKDRRLTKISPDVFHIIDNLKDTMTDSDSCSRWLNLRKMRGDLFQQAGHYSTIIIMTEEINFHIEYKQEHERCDAHSIDVWISHVSPEMLKEDWEGVIGETKNPPYKVVTGTTMERASVLKHPKDDAYEVNAPFSKECKGCARLTGQETK